MKRILFVSSCYPSETLPQYCIFLEQQAKALKSLNNQVDVLIPTNSESSCTSFHGIDIYFLHYRSSSINKFKYIIDRYFWNALIRLLKQNSYDIVSIHLCPDAVTRIIIRACRKFHIKVVVHYHGLNVWRDYYQAHPYYAYYQAMRRKRIISNADAIVGVSNKVCDIVKREIKNVPYFTVYNGVDCQVFQPNKANNHGIIHILCVANLIRIKGQKYLIEAFSKIIKAYPSKRFLLEIVGQGVDFPMLERMVYDLGLSDHVKFYGAVNYTEISSIMQNADIFVLPSFFEALGCVYLEAMACKVPVIACNGQGIEEIINEKVNGICVPPQNADKLAESIQLLLENKALRDSIAENGHRTVKNSFTWTHSAMHLLEVYNYLLRA